MKKLLITLLLISPFSFADWDDVYYCQMTNSVGITVEGKKENYNLEKFQFKLDKARNALVFGSSGYFADAAMELTQGSIWPTLEKWRANDQYSVLYFEEGKFLYVSIAMGATSKSADCDKF
mgnify:CR=1 FL=1